MNTLVGRLSRGYASLLRGILSLALAAVVLVTISAGVTLPIWWLADRFPRAYSLGVATLVLGGVMFLLILRRFRRDGASATLRRLMLGVTATILTVLAVAIGSPLALGAWLIVVTASVAYRLA
jgi:hypothetical protein